ncbi:fibrocystin-like [Sphaerodactylus townsendi]|uniref:fibrocystin-like n=1 Tax=Sphaerodactylus townsendi TaxID=933632 RepID=UPI002025FF91|nr:fibrocystin-like [Sphaerodactylus townsendi]
MTVTHLKSGARSNDTKLSLTEPVDWKPGDEVVVSGGGLGDAQKQAEVVTIKSVNGTDLYITSPLRYPHGISEEQVLGERLNLRAVVALLSRRVVVRGNVTSERLSRQKVCKEAAASGGERDISKCLYKASERKLGSQDMGAVLTVQAYRGEGSQLRLEGVQFRHVGQAFRKDLSALTIVGNTNMTESYIRDCAVLDSFARGMSLSGVSDLRVENNILYNIMGHGLHVGEWPDQKNQLKSNTIIGLSGTDGLSNIETFSPAGIYIQAADNLIEGNMVCAAGHGYFFHLSPTGLSQLPVLSFRRNVAHSCTRFVLSNYTGMDSCYILNITLKQQTIMSSSNLQLQAFLLWGCRDFGIDIVESPGNTSVANSLFLGHSWETIYLAPVLL